MDPAHGDGLACVSHRPDDGARHRASRLRLDLVHCRVLGLARSAALRAGVTFARLASPRARLLLCDRHVVLAVGDPCMARPIAVAAVDHDPVPSAGRSGEHGPRSEEHTSELQSLAYLVCRLLLEKKKKKIMIA